MNEKIFAKFWDNVDKSSFCWNWIGYLDKTGLPIIRVDGKEYRARRISLEIIGKDISPSNHILPLVCRNKLCVNPEHLICGDEARFWAKVQKLSEDECWVWTAYQDKNMYGKFRLNNGDGIRAHVYSWELYVGHSLPKNVGIEVCHKCDHPYCVNPNHLFLGTVLDNTEDKVNKGRQAKGEKLPQSKLNDNQIREIKTLYTTKQYTVQQLVSKFSVVRTTITSILRGKNWKHVK